jgi:hypothetical protein
MERAGGRFPEDGLGRFPHARVGEFVFQCRFIYFRLPVLLERKVEIRAKPS